MPLYEVKGKGKDTGRKRKRTYSAANELEAKRLAEVDGTLVDEITEMPPEPPTERQLDYAKDLGISIPANASKDDVSDLISLKVDRDRPATERHKNFGRMYNLEFSDFIGKKRLFSRIQFALSASGREKELLSWFTFRVYRGLFYGSENAPISKPDDPIIEEIAEELVTDEKVIKSVRRYNGSDLIWFGTWTSPDGYVHTGGSKRTEAYKQVSSMLKERVTFPTKPQKKERSSAPKQKGASTPKKKNNSLSIWWIIGAVIALYLMFK